MEESTLRWPTDKEREEMEEVCFIDDVITRDRICYNSVIGLSHNFQQKLKV